MPGGMGQWVTAALLIFGAACERTPEQAATPAASTPVAPAVAPKREALTGQLAGRDRLILPMVCAAAGVVVPALLFTTLNRGDAAAMRGWARSVVEAMPTCARC